MDLVGKRKLQHYGTLLQFVKDVSPWVIMAQFCVAVHQKVNTALNLTLPAAMWSKASLALAKGNDSTRHLTSFLATKPMASSKSLDWPDGHPATVWPRTTRGIVLIVTSPLAKEMPAIN